MTRHNGDSGYRTMTAKREDSSCRWGKSLLVASLTVLLAGVLVVPLTGVSTAQATSADASASATANGANEGLFGPVKAFVDRVWCWAFGCAEPVTITQSETIVVEDTPLTRQAESPEPAQTNVTVEARSNTPENVTVAEGGSETVGETVSAVPAGEGAQNTGGEAADNKAPRTGSSQQAQKVISADGNSAAPWWWLPLVAAFIFTTLALVGLALYRRFDDGPAPTDAAEYPTTLQPRVFQGHTHYTDGGVTTNPPGKPQSAVPSPVRLTGARDALAGGATDQSVSLAVQRLTDATEQTTTAGAYDALLASWEPTADELPELPASLADLHAHYEQAMYGYHAVSDEDAMACIETVEELLTAGHS